MTTENVNEELDDGVTFSPTPLVVTADNGDRSWFIKDKNGELVLHRVGGPAFEGRDGHKEYYVNGELHRTTGPAKFEVNGTKRHYYKGKLHCSNGPAVIYPDGGYEYWVHGEKGTVWTKNEKTFASKNKALNFLAGPINKMIKKASEIL